MMNIFSDFIPILDPYHALEHLSKFCRIVDNLDKTDKLNNNYFTWKIMMLNSEVYQLLDALNQLVTKLPKARRDSAQKEIDYFNTNKERMKYDEYLQAGIPIGAGNIEAACKKVICDRFKKKVHDGNLLIIEKS